VFRKAGLRKKAAGVSAALRDAGVCPPMFYFVKQDMGGLRYASTLRYEGLKLFDTPFAYIYTVLFLLASA